MPTQDPSPNSTRPEPSFGLPEQPRSLPVVPLSIAAAVVLIVVGAFLFLTNHKSAPTPNTLQPEASYASNLAITAVAMSQASSFSGSQALYIDGHLANHGPSTITGITVQVVFPNDVQMPPQIQTLPLTLITMRQPYIDTAPIRSAPIGPNAEADFRLSPDPVYPSWNQQLPQIRIIRVSTR